MEIERQKITVIAEQGNVKMQYTAEDTHGLGKIYEMFVNTNSMSALRVRGTGLRTSFETISRAEKVWVDKKIVKNRTGRLNFDLERLPGNIWRAKRRRRPRQVFRDVVVGTTPTFDLYERLLEMRRNG